MIRALAGIGLALDLALLTLGWKGRHVMSTFVRRYWPELTAVTVGALTGPILALLFTAWVGPVM